MSIFGWSYPPGAANDPNAPYNQEDPPCEVCGKDPYDCICPVCPVCEAQGDPACYEKHGLTRNEAQTAGRAQLDAAIKAQAERDAAEGAYWADPQRKVEAAELEQYWRDLEAHQREQG